MVALLSAAGPYISTVTGVKAKNHKSKMHFANTVKEEEEEAAAEGHTAQRQ